MPVDADAKGLGNFLVLLITAADSTVPHWAKYSRSVSLVVEYESPPTYSFEAI